MTRNSTERLDGEYDLESRIYAFSCSPSRSQHKSPKHLQMWYYADFKGGDVLFLRGHLYCCNRHMDESNGIRKSASLNLAHSFCCLQ